MATTTNYGWTTPDDTALVKDGASAIRTLGTSVDTTTKNLNPSTTLGDIEYRSSTANTNTRLGIGTTGQVLTVAAGVPSWSTPAAAGFVGVSITKTAVQSMANNTSVLLTFESEEFDTSAFHDNATNNSRITIPAGKAGYYAINAHLTFRAQNTGLRQIEIWKNGAVLINHDQNTQTNISDASGLPIKVVYASVGDYFQAYGLQSSGVSINIVDGSTQTYFQMYFLGA